MNSHKRVKILVRAVVKLLLSGCIMLAISCTTTTKSKQKMERFTKGSYGYDLAFLKKHTQAIELQNGSARVIVSPEYQGRVMTSSADGEQGLSFGWINYDLIASGEILEQINPVGGEERMWLGPEGGQYSIFFKNGDSFDFSNWSTPACLDTEVFDVAEVNQTSAVFTKSVELTNYSDFTFCFDIKRSVDVLNNQLVQNTLNIDYAEQVKVVAYQTVNQLTNTGTNDWQKDSGLLSIWMLGMFNPSAEVTVIVPYKRNVESDYIVKDDYFGKIPDNRLVEQDGIVFFKGDGKERGKIGIPPQRALPVIGSYDALNKVLTVLKCEIPENNTDYVNSAWELQEHPYKGDAINSYNDGPLEDGSQMGPFYELETSSPALALKRGETASFKQTTVHFKGEENELNAICQKLFKVSLHQVKAVFND